MFSLKRCDLVIYVLLVMIGACTTPPATLPTPTTTDALLTNLKTALGDERLLDDGFYTESNLKRFFGGTQVTKVYVENGKPRPFTRCYISGFSAMVPPMPLAGGRISLTGLRADIVKVAGSGHEHGAIIVTGSLDFHSDADDLEAGHVMKELGYSWSEDREAEFNAFMAIAREPFNPPAQRQYIMHHIWSEDGYKKEVVLNFGAGQHLWILNFLVTNE